VFQGSDGASQFQHDRIALGESRLGGGITLFHLMQSSSSFLNGNFRAILHQV
jgi:hypothetical protein